jgi:hypothetical protein
VAPGAKAVTNCTVEVESAQGGKLRLELKAVATAELAHVIRFHEPLSDAADRPHMRILVALEAVDLRKGIDGLAELCREKLSADPFSGCLFVFRSRGATAIKLLQYDGQGFVLAQKRRLSRNRSECERPEPLVPDNRPVRGRLHEFRMLEFQQVRRTAQEPLFNSFMEQYHYLRYEQPVGEHLKYLVCAKGQVVAVWHAPRRCGIWRAAIALSAGAPRSANAIRIYWRITVGF